MFSRNQFRNFDVNLRALPFLAPNIHLELIPVKQAQPLVYVADSDAAAIYLGEAFSRDPYAIIFNLDIETAISSPRADVNLATFKPRVQPVLDRVLDHRLQQHARNKRLESIVVDLLEDLQLVTPETDHFDI